MGTIKILGFDEDGNAQRLKIRIARFLDYDPVTASDKSNIRSTLGITSQGGLGDLLAANNLDDVASLDTTKANLEIPDVGTDPSQVPLNQHLGSMAYQSAEGISVDNLEVTGKLEIDSSGNVSIGAGDIANNGSLHVYRSSATADLNLQSAGGSGRSFAIQSKTNGSLVVRDNNGAADRLTVGSGGHIGISNNSPGSANGSANNLVIGNATDSTSTGISIVTQPGQVGSLFFADGTSGVSGYIGRVQYNHGTNSMTFGVNGIVPWAINSSGNFVANGAYGIDFGSVAGGTGTPITNGGLLDDYEAGSFVPVVADAASGGNTGSAATAAGEYTKVGRIVHFSLRLENIDTTGLTSGNTLHIRGLPFVAINASPVPNCAVRTDRVSFSDGIIGAVQSNTSSTYLASIRSGLSDLGVSVSDYVSGIADVYMSGSYIAA